MKKHSLAMVFLLILLLSLVSAVSAGDNQTVGDTTEILESQGEVEMDMGMNCEAPEEFYEMSYPDGESSVSDDTLELSYQGKASYVSSEIHAESQDVNYELGYEITADFIGFYDIESSNDVLVIVNAGYLQINNQTTENVLNGIIDASNGYITYEDGNLVVLSSNVDSIFISFFLKNDESLTIALYKDSKTPLYYGNAGPEMSAGQLECLMLDNDDLNYYLSILDSWTDGSLDDLNLKTYHHRYVPFGLLSECDALQTAKYYPHEFNLPLVDTLGVSRDFDDDAFILKKSNSSDEKASFAVNMVGKSMEESSSLNLYQIGVDATNKALNFLKSHVDIPKDYPYLYVLTSAGHVRVNGQKTTEVLDGILDTLGYKFNKKHLISVDDPSWKDLVFYFIVVKNTKYTSYALKYDSTSAKLVESNHVENIGIKKAKKLGIYSARKHYAPNYGYKHVFQKTVYKPLINNSNRTGNVTVSNSTNVTVNNNTNNVSNVSNKLNKSDNISIPVKNHGNPFNIVYNLVAILMVCVIFGVGYRKR